MLMCSICRNEVRCDQSADVNCVPLSDVIVCGTPNLAIQVEHSASAQAGGCDVGQRNGLCPSCGAVNDGVRVVVDLLCQHGCVQIGVLERGWP